MGGNGDLRGKRGAMGRTNGGGLPKTKWGSLKFRRPESPGHQAFPSLDPHFPHLLRVRNTLGWGEGFYSSVKSKLQSAKAWACGDTGQE